MSDAQRGREAKAILENAVVQDAMSHLETHWIEAWQKSEPEAADVREDAYRMLRAARQFRRFFEQCVANGKVAEADEARKEQKRP